MSQPAAGDAGGALGAALCVWHRYLGNDRNNATGYDTQQGSYLGPSFPAQTVEKFLSTNNYVYHKLDSDKRARTIAELISEGKKDNRTYVRTDGIWTKGIGG